MKLRLRSVETKETLKIETPNPCSLQQLRELVSQKLPSTSTSTIHFSLNRKDQLTTESPQESIQSIGITSGDLIYFTTNPNGFSTAPVSRQSQNPQTVIPASSDQDETLNTVASEKVDSGNNSNAEETAPVSRQSQNTQTVIPASSKQDETLNTVASEKVDSGNNSNAEEIAPVSRQSQNTQTVIPASSKQDETLNTVASEKVDSGNNSNAEEIAESMEIEDGESSAINEVGKSFSVPGFLRKVFTEELRDSDGLNRKLLRVAVHAVLLESGFVKIDPASNMLKDGNNFGVKDNWYLASVHYTLPEISGNVETVKIKFQNLGKYCKVYGSLVNGTMVHSVLVDEDKLVPFLNVVWANCGAVVATMAENNEIANVEPEKQVFEFWRKIKDGISLPLLIDLCEKAGLQAPPCFMQLPTELILKILESLSGIDIAKLSCVCSELRYLMLTHEFIINTPLRNIYDLWQITKPQFVIILGTINAIDKHFGWHYMECPKCLMEAGTYMEEGTDMEEHFFHVCRNPNCDESVIYPIQRFKIKVQVEDNSDYVSLILFHPLVDKIIQKVVLKSAEQLFAENTKPDVEEVMFPVDLNNLIGKMFAFKIEITAYNFTSFDEKYFVTKMTDDESIIKELKEKIKIIEVNDKEFIKKNIHDPSVKG